MDYNQYTYSAARSILAYRPFDVVRSVWQKKDASKLSYALFEHVDMEPIFFNDDATSAQGFSYVQGRVMYITFRGTQERHDIMVDIDTMLESFFPTEKKKIRVHQGFLKQFRALEPAITKEIERCSIDTITFSGHSLGAALATVAAAYYGYKYKGSPAIICHTFGCPRVGNTHFMELFQTYVHEHARITNEKDPVPIIPVSGSFTHTSHSITVNDAHDIRVLHDVPWYWRIFYFPFQIDYTAPIKHHSCVLYLERMMYFAKIKIDFADLLQHD